MSYCAFSWFVLEKIIHSEIILLAINEFNISIEENTIVSAVKTLGVFQVKECFFA